TEKTLKSRNCRLEGIITAAENRISELGKTIAEQDKRLINYAEISTRNAERAAELESRTVKLPDLRQIVSGDRYVWSDGVYNYSQDVKAALTAAGIKWEAE
ncbi:TPA: ead/Ea22-like family protein, partial [Klebsiella pneumoniae]